MLITGHGHEVEQSVRHAVDIARSVKSWPLQILSALLLALVCIRLWRTRQWAALALIAALAVSLQLRRVLDYSDRTLVIVVLIEVTVAIVADAIILAQALRQRSKRKTAGASPSAIGG